MLNARDQYIQEALKIYRKREAEVGRTIVGNEENFKEWAGKQYDDGKTLEEVL